MKTFLVVCLVLTVTVLGKESVNDLVSLLDDPDVLQEIVKRLGHNVPVEKSDADSQMGDTDSCQYKNFTNTIIQTKASTAAGAAFLDSVNGMVSNYDCIKRCCELDGCELAVYENKGDRNCYLFRCKDPDTNKNYCEFASLDGYISSSITHDIKADKIFQTSSNSDHENDLQDLSESGKLVDVHTTTTSTTTTTEKPEEPHSVSIGGVCKTHAGCEDSHAFCLNGICTCITSYYNKHGTCREVCGRSRFECKVVDLDGPDCIRNSLVCDGRKDCHDGSDELNCQTDDNENGLKSSNTKMKPHHKATDHHDKDMKEPSAAENIVPDIHPKTPSKESPIDRKQNPPNISEDTLRQLKEDAKSTEVTEESKSDTAELKSNEEESKQSTDSSESKEENTPENKDTGSNDGLKDENDITLEEMESLLVSKGKLMVDSPIQTAQGPIIALSLGLAFTFLLLVFIGCRLRNMKKRLRKGRVLHSNEADYLINGMYL